MKAPPTWVCVSAFRGASQRWLRGALLATCAATGLAQSGATADSARVSSAISPTGGRITIDAQGVQPTVPLFFTASIDEVLRISDDAFDGEARVSLRILQGKAEVLTLGLAGDGDVIAVSGAAVRDWAVRYGTGGLSGRRYLDIRPAAASAEGPKTLELIIKLRRTEPIVPGRSAMLLITGGDGVATEWQGRFEPDASVDLRVASAAGVAAIDLGTAADRAIAFVGTGEPSIELQVYRRGAGLPDVELTKAQLIGRLNDGSSSVAFRLRAQARVERLGSRIRLLSGRAALSAQASGDGWHVDLGSVETDRAYDLVFDRKGIIAVELDFVAAVMERGDWRGLDFRMEGAPVVPVTITGFAQSVDFAPADAVVLNQGPSGWQGFLPANGHAVLAWKTTRERTEGALFFTSTELSDVRVASGLLRETSQITFRVLQGKLASIRIRVLGAGEILGVDGTNLLSWRLVPDGDSRKIEVRLSRPLETEGMLTVESQGVLGGFPVRAEPIRLVAEGGIRHAGFVRISNVGAVRLEVAGVEGMMQLAPEQYPGAPLADGARQVFAYRFPAAQREYHILASQILPEVAVSEVTTYELAEADRVIQADLELDIREAPLRDWSLGIPTDYAVANVQGADLADYALEAGVSGGARVLKLLFKKPVTGRQLIRLRLERNQTAGAGEWQLPPLRFPGAKSVRGHIGVGTVPGYRVIPGAVERVVEVPLSLFPKQVAGLQQAFRVREPDWSAAMRIEALGQSIQADMYHLYSLKPGAISASVLINYFVVGAPANEWRIEVPADAGNIDVVGQGVRRDWRRQGNTVIVALHQPVLGASTLLVTFEEPMSARGGTIHPGEVRPIGVQAERGFVQVVSPEQVQMRVEKADGALLELEPLELPPELRLLTTAPSLAIYQYTARPFSLDLAVHWYPPSETVDQVVDFAQLASQVARDGQVVTEAHLFIKTRGRKVLRFQLPQGVKLWETRVDGELITARADGGWILVPLTARLNPNEPVSVALRLGQAADGSGRSVTLMAPKLSIPIVVGEWTVHSDAGRLLVPRSGNVELSRPTLTETGFEWVDNHAAIATAALLMLLALALLAIRTDSMAGATVALISGTAAVVFAFSLAGDAVVERRPNLAELTYASTIVPANGVMVMHLANVPAWQAYASGWGIVALVAGMGVWISARLLRQRRWAPGLEVAGGLVAAAGLLDQRGGAAPFFVAIAGVAFACTVMPAARTFWRRWRSKPGGAPSAPSTAVSLIAIGLALAGTIGGVPRLRAEPVSSALLSDCVALQSLVQRWDVHEHRLYAEVDVTLRGAPGDSFLLLTPPAVLTEFVGDGMHVTTLEGGNAGYYIVPDRPGVLTGRAKFEVAVADLSKGLPILTGPAAVQRVTVQVDQGGWDFASARAVEITPNLALGPSRSGATIVLGLAGEPVVRVSPRTRDVTAETSKFVAEVANLFVPAAGVVNAFTRVRIRPVQGRLTALDVRVPDGISIGDVGRGPIGTWQFDAGKHLLHVAIEPARPEPFEFTIESQRAASAQPYNLKLQPFRVGGAAGEVGTLAIAFSGDVQPEDVRATGGSPISADDFPPELLPQGRDGQPLATLQAAFRYSGPDAAVDLRVASVAPEVRVIARELLSLGDDRVVLAADLNVTITRVGVFQLGFALPAGMELEAASGSALSHWTEADEDRHRVITLHLIGRTIGRQTFALTLIGPVPSGLATWSVPQVRIREATRQVGDLQVIPDQGIRLRAVERRNVSELDPRSVGNNRPGALAFRLLEDDWSLGLAIETLDPWVTLQSLQEVTVREGQTLTRLALQYRIENAAVKQLRVKLPGMTEDQARTVRATGAAVSDLVPVAGTPDEWEIRFQRGIIGETAVQIEYRAAAPRSDGRQTVTTPVYLGVRQAVQFVAMRAGGQLELDAPALPRGWQRIDWTGVPMALQDRSDRSVPALSFRVAEPEQPLAAIVRRHGAADALKLRVTAADLTTLFSASGPTLTAAELRIEVEEKSTLRVRLPESARLFNTFVNGESVPVVREDDAYLFHVAANTTTDRTARVRLVYVLTVPQRGAVALRGPRLDIPLENLTWRVLVPPGYEVASYRGGLRLEQERGAGPFHLDDYEALVVSKRAADAKQAAEVLQEANALLQRGQQQKAGEVLARAANSSSLDEASNEDARVQLRALRTQQAILGLNTRRQRMYLDNSAAAIRNEQLEQAANLNPLMRGKLDFDPQRIDELLMGNSVEENSALRGIAGRIVDQQLGAESPPSAIDVTLPERGRVLTFARRLQVNGNAPLELELAISQSTPTGALYGAGLLAGLAVISGLVVRKR